jgi:hypothetical protein
MGMNQGISSKNVRHTTAAKTEPRPKAINPGGVGQLGEAQGRHSTNKGDSDYSGDKWSLGPGYRNPVGPTNMALEGPGAGCNIMPHGGQGRHGAPNPGQPRPQGRGILTNE